MPDGRLAAHLAPGADPGAGRRHTPIDDRAGFADRRRPRPEAVLDQGGGHVLQTGVPRRLLSRRPASGQHVRRRRRQHRGRRLRHHGPARPRDPLLLGGHAAGDPGTGLPAPGRGPCRGRLPAPRPIPRSRSSPRPCARSASRSSGGPCNEISFARLLAQLLQLTEAFDMPVQPQLLLLQKNMLMAEGVSRSLEPSLNIWVLAQPLIEAWMREHRGPEARLRDADAQDAGREPAAPAGAPEQRASSEVERSRQLAGVRLDQAESLTPCAAGDRQAANGPLWHRSRRPAWRDPLGSKSDRSHPWDLALIRLGRRNRRRWARSRSCGPYPAPSLRQSRLRCASLFLARLLSRARDRRS